METKIVLAAMVMCGALTAGCAGSEGAPGAPGAAGAKGDKGDTGAAGAAGAAGEKGADGKASEAGIKSSVSCVGLFDGSYYTVLYNNATLASGDVEASATVQSSNGLTGSGTLFHPAGSDGAKNGTVIVLLDDFGYTSNGGFFTVDYTASSKSLLVTTVDPDVTGGSYSWTVTCDGE